MVGEVNKEYNNTILNISSGELFDKSLKNIGIYSIALLLCLLAGILLLSFDKRLFAGFFVIAGSCAGYLIIKEAYRISRKFKESIIEFSTLNEKKDFVISEFSHKIREPLNNLVTIVDILMESGLNKKQKELLETFVASTDNMVTTVNELTMQSAGNISHEQRKAIKFNLLSTIQNTIEFHNLKEKARIDFILNKKDQDDYECFGDPIMLKQIFLDLFNTIDNNSANRTTKVTINLNKAEESGNTKGYIFQNTNR